MFSVIDERWLRREQTGDAPPVAAGSEDWTPEDEIAANRTRNVHTWEALQKHGVTEATELRLDFSYEVPNASAAKQLAEFLRAETDYDVALNEEGVSGTTQPTTVSPPILDEWVEWMILAGYENGRCMFDGWGAEVP